MSTARVHARNLIANWVAHGANLVVMFFLSPFIVHTLGETEYGVWSLLMVLTGYMGVFDLGVRASTGRYVILYFGRGDHDRVNETVRTGLGFFTAAVAVIVVIAAGIAWGFPRVFSSMPEQYHVLVKLLLPLLALNVWLSAVAAVFSSVVIAHDRFDLARGVDLGVLLVRTVGTVLALKWGYGILGLTVVTLACGVAALAANYVLARRVYHALRAWPAVIVGARLRELFDYGLPAFVATVADQTASQAGLLIVGALVSVASVTVYSVGAMLVFYSSTFIGLVATTFFPSVQRAAARGDKASLQKYYLRQVKLGFIFGLPAYLGFIVFGQAFIRLWMGGPAFPEDSVLQAAVVMALLSAARLASLSNIGGESMLAATGYVRITAVIAVAEAVVNLGLSLLFVLVFGWGLTGVAAGTLTAAILVRTWFVPWQAMRRANLSYTPYMAAIGAAVPAAAAVAAWYLAVRAYIPAESWPTFALDVAIALLGYGVIAVLVLIPKDDRRRVLHALAKISGSTTGRRGPAPAVVAPAGYQPMVGSQTARVLRVGVFGNTFWAGRLAESLAGCPVEVRCLYADQETALKGWSVGQWLAKSDLYSFDVLHVLGWPTLWNLWMAARLKRVPTVCHWLGSDVSSFRASPRWSRVAGPALNLLVTRHLADSPTLVQELRGVGVHAEVATVGIKPLEGVAVPALPASPRVLAMLRPDKFEFYGGGEVLEMARAAPDVRWLILAHDGAGLPRLPNVEYLGKVEDIEEVYRRTTVLVRLTQHDGIAQMVLEALARGRHVVWSYPMPCCLRASKADEALPLVRKAIASGTLNLEGAEYVRKAFDGKQQAQQLASLYARVARG